jgi:hypothetical protein
MGHAIIEGAERLVEEEDADAVHVFPPYGDWRMVGKRKVKEGI